MEHSPWLIQQMMRDIGRGERNSIDIPPGYRRAILCDALQALLEKAEVENAA